MKPRVRVKANARPMLTVVSMERPVNGEAVVLADDFVAGLKSGTYDGIAIAATSAGGKTVTAFLGGRNAMLLLAATDYLAHRIRMAIG